MEQLREADLLLGKQQVIIKTKFLWFVIKWRLGKLTLYRSLKLTKEYLKLRQDDESIKSEDEEKVLSALYYSVLNNADTCGKILSIAVDSWLPKWLLKWHLMRNVDSKQLAEVVHIILKETNLANFSIAISGMKLLPKTRPNEVA